MGAWEPTAGDMCRHIARHKLLKVGNVTIFVGGGGAKTKFEKGLKPYFKWLFG